MESSEEVETSTKDLLLEFDQQIATGWELSELKAIRSSANSKRCDTSVAAVRAIVKSSNLSSATNLYANSFKKLIFSLNPSVRVVKENRTLVQVVLSGNLKFVSIPKVYAFKGGAARIALLHVLGMNTRKLVARDLDLWRIGHEPTDQDLKVSEQYMPDDFKFGHGIELQASIEDYILSRDLTINEVSLNGQKLIFSKIAFEDLRAGNVRLSAQYQNDYSRINAKLICKMIRLKAELELLGLQGTLFLPSCLPTIKQSDVDFHLDRARTISTALSKRYLELIDLNLGLVNIKPTKPKSNHEDCSGLKSQNGLQRFRKLQRKRL